jgi:hypothetical protein
MAEDNRADGYHLIACQDHSEWEEKAKIRELITIYEGNGNGIGSHARRAGTGGC